MGWEQQKVEHKVEISNFAEVAELNVLGSILLSPDTIAIAREILKPDDFYCVANQSIFNAMCEFDDSGQQINIATIYAKLASNPSFAEKGGISHLMTCEQRTPTASLITSYAEVVRADSIRRKLSNFGDRLKVYCTKPIEDADSAVSQLSDELLSISNGTSVQKWQDFRSALKITLEELTTLDENSQVKTGFKELDSKLYGLKPGSLTVIAARPAMGKTAFGLNILTHVALKQNIPVAFFSLEMTTTELMFRVLSSMSSVNGNAIKQKRMNDSEWNRLINTAELYSKANVYIDETPSIDITLLRERARRINRQHGLGMVIIDYIQLMRSDNKRALNREQEVATISRGLKALAKELHIPVIALAQVNRNIDSRVDKHPLLSDLRESGAIEQDSDNILFIHREDYYRQDENKDNTAEIIIAKQRSGPTGIVKLKFEGEYTRFSNLDNPDDSF